MKRTVDYEKLFREALQAGQDRKYPRAIELLTRITSETDGMPQAFLYLGRAYHAIGRYDLAIRPLQYFIERNPNESAGYFFLGRAFLSLEIPSSAVQNFKRVLEMEPDTPQTIGLIGMAYLKAHRPEIASSYLGRAVELDPDNKGIYTAYLNALLVQAIRVFHKGDIDLAGQMLEFILAKGRDGILLHLYLAIIYREQGELRKALEQYNFALEIDPEDPVILFQRAVLYHRLGKTARAQKELRDLDLVQDADQFSWDSPSTDRVFAVQHFQKGKYVKAIFFAEKILRKESKDIDMHLLVGESYRILGELEKASNHFHRVLDANRELLEPRYGLSLIHWQKEEWSELRTELARIERIDPGNETSSYYSALCACELDEPTETTIPRLQGQIRASGPDAFLLSALAGEYIKAGMPELSEKWYDKALLLSENHRPAYLGLIRLYEELEEAAKLRDAYSRFLARFDDESEIRRNFIHFLVDAEDFELAAEQIQKYIPHRKDDKRLQRLLALCYRRTERYREASIIYRQLLRENPENEDNLRSLVYCMDKLGNHPAAIDLLEKALDYLKPSVSLRLIAGVLLYKAEEYERALKHFRAVVDLAKGDWRGYYNMAMVYKKQGMAEFAQKYFAKADTLKGKPSSKTQKKPAKKRSKAKESELSSRKTRV